jgi:hypothetical protein
MSARRLPSSKLNAKSRIVHGVELVDCEQDAVQQVQHRTTGKKRSIPNDLQSTLFHEKVYEFRRRYPHVFIDQAPVFRWLVQFPNGSTMRYRTARELRDATGLSRAAFENLANGILPQQGEEENYPQIHAIFQTWNEAALPDSTAARQAYRGNGHSWATRPASHAGCVLGKSISERADCGRENGKALSKERSRVRTTNFIAV